MIPSLPHYKLSPLKYSGPGLSSFIYILSNTTEIVLHHIGS